MFSFFKKRGGEIEIPKEPVNSNLELELRPHNIDDLLVVPLPVDFIPFESDRFRAITQDKKRLISITNHAKPHKKEMLDKKFYENLKLELYDRFVNEGGYEAYDDLKATDKFIRRGFKVDDETQYYFTSARIIDGNIVITDFIVREVGDYNKTVMPMLEIINDMIKY